MLYLPRMGLHHFELGRLSDLEEFAVSEKRIYQAQDVNHKEYGGDLDADFVLGGPGGEMEQRRNISPPTARNIIDIENLAEWTLNFCADTAARRRTSPARE